MASGSVQQHCKEGCIAQECKSDQAWHQQLTEEACVTHSHTDAADCESVETVFEHSRQTLDTDDTQFGFMNHRWNIRHDAGDMYSEK